MWPHAKPTGIYSIPCGDTLLLSCNLLIMKNKEFDARVAAKALLNIMRHMGVNTDKPAHDTWINEDSNEHAVICLGCNFIKCSVTKDGFSFFSSHALFPMWSKRSTSRKQFNKEMQHVLFWMR